MALFAVLSCSNSGLYLGVNHLQARTRQRTKSKSYGAWYGWNTVSHQWEFVQGSAPYQIQDYVCKDYIKKAKSTLTGRTPPSELMMSKKDSRPVLINYFHKSAVDGKPFNKYVDMPGLAIDASTSPPPSGWAQLEGTTNELVAKLLANSNPFRYEISVPVTVLELVEATSLLKLVQQNFVATVGSAHLNWTFGYETMMSDIRTLTNITKYIELRIKEFNTLIEKGGIRAKVFLKAGGVSDVFGWNPVHSSGLGTWWGQGKISWRTKVWGTVRWVPDRLEPLDLKALTSFNQAAMTVMDLRAPDLSTIWEALPFSWLADYFVNIGDVLHAIETDDLVVPTEICIMRHREVITTTDKFEGPPSSAWDSKESTFSEGVVKCEYKLRELPLVNGVGDLLHFGFMSEKQTLNLAALLMSLTRFKL